MKAKTEKSGKFLNDLYKYISHHPLMRKDTAKYAETDIQREIRPIIIEFLSDYWKEAGRIDFRGKAMASFYWEGQEGNFGLQREPTFGARNYPDFIIKEPYTIAIEYKQSESGALVKHGIGQSIVHTMSGDFDFVLLLFKDENKDDRIAKSFSNSKEKTIVDKIWNDFNVMVKVLPFHNK